MSGQIEIYQGADGTQIEVQFEEESVWLSLNQISELFGKDKSVVSRHIQNIYKEGELLKKSTVVKNATVQIEAESRGHFERNILAGYRYALH